MEREWKNLELWWDLNKAWDQISYCVLLVLPPISRPLDRGWRYVTARVSVSTKRTRRRFGTERVVSSVHVGAFKFDCKVFRFTTRTSAQSIQISKYDHGSRTLEPGTCFHRKQRYLPVTASILNAWHSGYRHGLSIYKTSFWHVWNLSLIIKS